ncbi:hypothetical protein AVEN_134856-1 [Araneus ventricosus]|uniref:Uncharacterized protein n=1 Tax=Araneus ventricosus TaxID=182803 RepID=A0A4Y2G8U3_ARAVE|nr:hypothetical protein AVEN_134856-1 [Araneus ventricosus]
MMGCYSGMEGVSKEELKDYHCSHSPEELEEGDKCLNQKMKDEGKVRKIIFKLLISFRLKMLVSLQNSGFC